MFLKDLSEINEGITTIFITQPDSEVYHKIQKSLEDNELGSCMYFVDSTQSDSKVMKSLEMHEVVVKNSGKDLLLFVTKKEGVLQIFEHKASPEAKYDWLDVAKALQENHASTEPDESGYYKWGQTVPEGGESYLCIDCGYIIDLKPGDIFPVCEVCLAGDPAGPMSVRDGYWDPM